MQRRSPRLSGAAALRLLVAGHAALALACAPRASRIDASRPTAGTTTVRGSLVIVGGGPRPAEVMERFVSLAGGPGRARVVVFPMATASAAEVGPGQAREFQQLGASAWSLDLSREQAMQDSVARSLDSATGIWFSGGDQNRIMTVLRGTPVAAAIRARYAAGAVVGGTSAGAAIMTTPMITGDERRPGGDRPDTSQNWLTIASDNVVTAEGLGLLEGAIVDQHFVRRRRHNRLMSLVIEHPNCVGVGIDEATALVVEPNGWWSVVGRSAVVIYDARRGEVTQRGRVVLGARDVRVHILPPGGRFDPRSGRAELPPD
ncbi:MAG: cyanophycinase [Gemmatimonadaceae bacterium]